MFLHKQNSEEMVTAATLRDFSTKAPCSCFLTLMAPANLGIFGSLATAVSSTAIPRGVHGDCAGRGSPRAAPYYGTAMI